MFEVDPFGGAFVQLAGGAVQGRENEIARVEDPRAGVPQPVAPGAVERSDLRLLSYLGETRDEIDLLEEKVPRLLGLS